MIMNTLYFRKINVMFCPECLPKNKLKMLYLKRIQKIFGKEDTGVSKSICNNLIPIIFKDCKYPSTCANINGRNMKYYIKDYLAHYKHLPDSECNLVYIINQNCTEEDFDKAYLVALLQK